jgi:hypothetical protein
MDPRFLRQVLLPEIGAEGQARIGRAAAAVLPRGASLGGAEAVSGAAADPLAHEVAALYARGAGFGALSPGDIDVAALSPASIVAAPAARAVLAGARAALAQIRAAIDPREDAGGERS